MKRHHIIFTFLLTMTFVFLTGYAGGLTKPDPVKAPNFMKMVLVKGGCYMMGNTFKNGRKDEQPVHQVCLSDFYIGKYEVTRGQWKAVMGDNPTRSECSPDCAMNSVKWNMAQEFIKRLNSRTGKEYRLPTEAEWEYAARSGGKKEKWAGTSDKAKLKEFAWHDTSDEIIHTLHPVGLKKPNGLGLYDMSGNALEWCQDWYSATYYAESPRDNPKGPAIGKERVLRGEARLHHNKSGQWARSPEYTAKRLSDNPIYSDAIYGFRLVLPVTAAEKLNK